MKKKKIFILFSLMLLLIFACGKEKTKEDENIFRNKKNFIVNKENFEEYKLYLNFYILIDMEKNLFEDILELSYFEFLDLETKKEDLEQFTVLKNSFIQKIRDIRIKIFEIKERNMKNSEINLDKELFHIEKNLNKLEEKLININNFYFFKNISKDSEKLKKLYEEFSEAYTDYSKSEFVFKEKIISSESDRYRTLLEDMKNKGSDIEEKLDKFQVTAELFLEIILDSENIEYALDDLEIKENLEAFINLLEYSYYEVTQEFLKYSSLENDKDNIKYQNLNFHIFNQLVELANKILVNVKQKNKKELSQAISDYSAMCSLIIETENF